MLPKSLGTLRQLQHLDLSENYLMMLPREIFEQLKLGLKGHGAGHGGLDMFVVSAYVVYMIYVHTCEYIYIYIHMYRL